MSLFPGPSFPSPSPPSLTKTDSPTSTLNNDLQPTHTQPWDGLDLMPPSPPAFISNGGYIYLVLLMALVIGTVYFCRVVAAKRQERLQLLKEQEMAHQYQLGSNGLNPPLYGHHDRDIPVVVIVADDEYPNNHDADPAPFYMAQAPSGHSNAAASTTTSSSPTETTAPSRLGRRRSSRPIELQPVGTRTTTAQLVSPAAAMVRGEPYTHILTPRMPSPAPGISETQAASSSQDDLQHQQPPAYEDIAATPSHFARRRSMLISETRLGIGHQHPVGPGQRPLSKPQ